MDGPDQSEAEMGYRVDDRAIINRRLAASAFRPNRLRRDEPTHDDDSGWVLMIGDEKPEDFGEPSRWAATQLGYVTDLYPELEDVFRRGEPGDIWEWDESLRRYRRVDE
ncbi:MAG: hypothetical protein ACRDKT_12870 [Actinomycetota bacterium]